MTEEDRKRALNELSKSGFLQNAARKAGLSAVDAEDAAQDALVKLSGMSLDTFAGIGDIRRYGWQIIRNQAVKMASSRKKVPPHIDITDAEHETLPQESFPDPFKSYDLEQMRQSVQEVLESLEYLEGAVARGLINDESGPVLAQRFRLTVDVIRGARERLRKKLAKFRNGWRDRDGQ
jgi:RNA polymerase sigma factor (sigma-70 family)